MDARDRTAVICAILGAIALVVAALLAWSAAGGIAVAGGLLLGGAVLLGLGGAEGTE